MEANTFTILLISLALGALGHTDSSAYSPQICTPETNIRVSGGTNPGEEFLSSTASGLVDLYSQDDNSGRQKWVLHHLEDNVFNILVSGGTDPGEKYLSCRADGHVDLYSHDDGSGRQKWVLNTVNLLGSNTFNIRVFNGTNAGEEFLSCRADGFVDLYSHDDASGRQRWVIDTLSSSPCLSDVTNIRVAGGTNPGEEFLSCTASGYVDLYSQDDNSGRQKWVLQPLWGNVYNILVSGGTYPGEEYLSCRADGFVDLYSHDDDSGRQKWILDSAGFGAYNIRVYDGTNAGEEFLSCRADGFVDLYLHDDGSGRQQWIIDSVRSSMCTENKKLLSVPNTHLSGNKSYELLQGTWVDLSQAALPAYERDLIFQLMYQAGLQFCDLYPQSGNTFRIAVDLVANTAFHSTTGGAPDPLGSHVSIQVWHPLFGYQTTYHIYRATLARPYAFLTYYVLNQLYSFVIG